MTELFENTIWPAFIQKFRSVRSVDNYRYILNDFYRFTGRSFELCQTSDAKEYDKYLEQLEYATDSRKIKHSTHVEKISTLRSIGDFIESCNFIPGYENPFNQVIVKAVEPDLASNDIPTVEDLERLFNAATDSPMDFLLFLLAGKCALSISQICALTMNDLAENLDGELSGLILRNGRYSHTILLPDDVLAALKNYLDVKSPSDSLFVNKRHTPLKKRDLQRIIKRYTEKLSDELYMPGLTFQDLRHAAIKYMKIGGATDEEIAQYTGISTPGMFSRYNKISEEDMDYAVSYSVLSVNTNR